jgi:hypothetical protein
LPQVARHCQMSSCSASCSDGLGTRLRPVANVLSIIDSSVGVIVSKWKRSLDVLGLSTVLFKMLFIMPSFSFCLKTCPTQKNCCSRIQKTDEEDPASEDEDCEGCDTLWVHHSPEQQPAASSLPIHVAPPGKSRVLGAVVPGMSLLLGFHARGSEGGG